MDYEVTGKIGGKRIIKFHCPFCAVPIDSPLEEAGQHFPCPSCSKQFLTPGLPELQQQRDHFKTKEQAQQAERRRAAQDEAQLAEKLAAAQQAAADSEHRERQARSAAQQGKPATATVPPKQSELPTEPVPEYQGIITGAKMFRALMFLCWVLAVLFLFGFLAAFISSRTPEQTGEMFGWSLYGLISSIVSGTFFYLLSSLSLAVRDIARNSFRR